MRLTAFGLAWRTAMRYKARALLAVAGVAIIGALNFDMLLLSHGLMLSFADMLNSVGYDVRVVGSLGLPMMRMPISEATRLATDLQRLPQVDRVAVVRMEQAAIVEPNSHEVAVQLIGTSEPFAAGAWAIVRGSNLDAAGPSLQEPPIIITNRLASSRRLDPGSSVLVRVKLAGVESALPSVACRVIGIGDFAFEAADELTIATTTAGFQAIHGGGARDEADIVLVASKPDAGPDAAVDAISRVRPDLRAFSNEQVMEQFNRNGMAYFRQISLVLSSTTIVFSFLLVATLLTVSVNQRLGEVAALRALGIARRRIAGLLLWESALLVGSGGLAALPLGWLLAGVLDRILRQMPGLPERLHFFVFEPRALIMHVTVLALTAIVAALYPMWLAVSLPIAQTLRREVVS